MDFYKGKVVLVTGGTGSIGSVVVDKLIKAGAERVVVFSRTDDKRLRLDSSLLSKGVLSSTVKYVTGDVRDYESVCEAAYGCDVVIHVAAMKYIPSCQNYPYEAVLTNIVGAYNVRSACFANDVDTVVVVSTDKAACPQSVMGMTKFLQEQVFLHPDLTGVRTVIVRFGNVLGSEGSVVWKFKYHVQNNTPIPITDKAMVRYVMTPTQAADLVLWAGANANHNNIVVKDMPKCYIIDLAAAMIPDGVSLPITEVGIRNGEKLDEVLLNWEEQEKLQYANDLGGIGVIGQERVDWPAKLESRFLSIQAIRTLLVEAGVLP